MVALLLQGLKGWALVFHGLSLVDIGQRGVAKAVVYQMCSFEFIRSGTNAADAVAAAADAASNLVFSAVIIALLFSFPSADSSSYGKSMHPTHKNLGNVSASSISCVGT